MPSGGPDRVSVTRLSSPRALREELAADVRAGLTAHPKWLPSKYFYDARGSALFEAITRLPEYHLTRAETAILEREAPGIVAEVRPDELVELGSGSARKTRLLLEAMHAHGSGDRYVPIDVSEDALRDAADTLARTYPWLEVAGLVGDFHADLERIPRDGTRLVAFLGSTIGNLDRPERGVLLRDVATLLGPDDAFLLGVDLVGDPATMVAAYDDPQGVTAAFNRNVLHVVNRELDADFPVAEFSHVVRWNAAEERIESSLRAERDLTVTIVGADLEVRFAAGEELHTELSCKFRRDGLTAELDTAGLTVQHWLTDDAGRFAVVVARLR